MSKSIYEEAIADAKKVREAAEVNAKNAILESVTPKIREFIEQAILEQDINEAEHEKDAKNGDKNKKDDSPKVLDGNGEDPKKDKDEGHCNTATKEEAVALDESAISALLGLLGGEDILDDLSTGSSKRAMNSVVNEAINNLSASEREKLFNIADKLERNADILESNVINNDVSLKENNDMAQETFYEVDLRSLKRAVNEGKYEKHEGDKHSMEEKMGHRHSMEEEDDRNEGLSELELNELMSLLEQDEEAPPAVADMDIFGGEPEGSPDLDAPMDDEPAGDEGGEGDVELPRDLAQELLAILQQEVGEDEEEEVDIEVDEEPAEDEAGALEEVYEIDPAMLRRELRNIKRTLREGKGISKDMEAQFGGKGHANAGIKNSYGGKGTGKVGVKRAFGGGSEGQDPFANPPQINKLNEALRQQVRLNRDLSEKLTKYRGAVKSLREQLEDLNLFNAKLLYVNKLLQNKSLNESQRKSIIKALDKAGSINEAKTLFKSLTETFSRPRQGGSKTLTESRTRGSSSRPTTSAASKNTGNAELGRWAKLAGLK
jgi:hypothetical protein